MRSVISVFVALFLIVFFDESQNMQVIPQRANITYINPKYLEWANFAVKRYGRKSEYYMNLEGKKYHTWANNITVHLIFNEFLHNEYRRSFVEMHFKLCDCLRDDAFIGAMFRSRKIKCPVVQSELHLMNMTVPTKDFDYTIPFEKSRIDGVVIITDTDERVAEGHMFVNFKP